MLIKLMKHEFRATGRIMLPLFGLLLLTALGANFSVGGLLETDNRFLDALGALLVVAFAIAMAAVCLMSFALMVQRFYKNLLQDEGYLMMTLPVSVHQHLWSKLIVSTVWFAATIIVVILACCIMAFNIEVIGEIWDALLMVGRVILEKNALSEMASGALACVEFLLICVCGSFALCLRFYSAMAVGYSFPTHKALYSVVSYIVMDAVSNLLGGFGISLLNDSPLHYALLGWGGLSATAALHLSMWFIIILEVIYAAIFYILTVYFLQKRLNLE